MKKLTVGAFAHVDSGKTTLIEAMLYESGTIKKLGRVDHKDSFLDTDSQERARGITIFSKLCVLNFGESQVTLLDTPGHTDFSQEAERAMAALDYAILLVDGKEGPMAHTKTLLELLDRNEVPIFCFVNKMDVEGADKERTLAELSKLTAGRAADIDSDEDIAMTDEALMEVFLEESAGGAGDKKQQSDAGEKRQQSGAGDKKQQSGAGEKKQQSGAGSVYKNEEIANAVKARKLIPCFFGSALKNEGVKEFMQKMDVLMLEPDRTNEFSARVFKIAKDKNARLTYVKITGGEIKVRDEIRTGGLKDSGQGACDSYAGQGTLDSGVYKGTCDSHAGQGVVEKVSQIRKYSGTKYEAVDKAVAGEVVALAGLENTFAGQGLGRAEANFETRLEPLFNYKVNVLSEDAFTAYSKLKELEDEDPTLGITWDDRTKEISIDLMGPIQIEVLTNIARTRFGIELELLQGTIKYKETIASAVEGVGHYEPLKHYAEVHLLMEPLERGSGLIFDSSLSEDELDRNWQRLIMTHLHEKEHLGVLTKSPITDMRISIVAGKAHLKHTEGGDFRQATYRAIRNGLMKAKAAGKCLLLEPCLDFEITLPQENIGRAMTDIKAMGGDVVMEADMSLKGRCPAKTMLGYQENLASYTKGNGKMSVKFAGYFPCKRQDEVVTEIGYEAERDFENSADSIFCQHGAGVNVAWSEVDKHMHIPFVYRQKDWLIDFDKAEDIPEKTKLLREKEKKGTSEEKELDRIFEKTYGKIKDRPNIEKRQIVSQKADMDVDLSIKDELLIVDGYNVIFAWSELKELSKVNLDSARDALIEILANYQGFRKCRVMVVFDSYKVKGAIEHVEKHGAIEVAFTKEGQTADTFVEQFTYMNRKAYSIRVATSDALEQNSVLAHGAIRVSARELIEEIKLVEIEIKEIIERNNRGNLRNRISEEIFNIH